jgi:protein TonB
MAQRAFVFSSDLKTLGILTQIFEELSVECEPSHELALTIKRVSADQFDAILVDCDDLQTATLIFESLRSSTTNHNAMTVAIVDGKGGVPTAFRLGAKTVLSKPLSLEQARGTLRNALALQRRDAHENKSAVPITGNSPAPSAPLPAPVAQEPEQVEKSTAFKSFVPAQVPETPPSPPLTLPAISAVGQGAAAAAAPARTPSAASPMQLVSKPRVEPPAGKPEKPNVVVDKKPLEPAKTGTPTQNKTQTVQHDGAPSFAILGVEQHKSNRGLIFGMVLLVLVGSGIAAWTTQPRVRNGILREYGQLTHRPAPADNRPAVPVPAEAPRGQDTTANDAPPAPVPPEAQSAVAQPTAAQPAAAPATDSPAADAAQLAQGFQDNASAAPANASEPPVVPESLAAAHVLHRVAAWYPTKARHAHIKGSVVLNVSVAADGSVQSVDVVSGNPQLILAAQEAVKQWQFQPFYQSGKAAAFQTRVTISFPPAILTKP